jgi:hypothetical protein
LHYKQREGHCRVPNWYEENGFLLGQWVGIQRQTEDGLSAERRTRLNDIGFDWDPFETDWEEGFKFLKAYRDREGHCLVAAKHKENGFSLGAWVGSQRQKKESLRKERRDKLDHSDLFGIRQMQLGKRASAI